MQTFVPYADFTATARCLDMRRLGKQRVETLQILKALQGDSGWSNHPATKMWRGHELSLVMYGVAICDEWIQRGYKDTCRAKILAYAPLFSESSAEYPWWWGDPRVHASHRSNLLRKDRDHYGQFAWYERDDLPYVWPAPTGEEVPR